MTPAPRHLPLFGLLLAVMLAVLLPVAASGAPASRPVVHLRGSSSLLAMAQQVAEDYMREHEDASIVVSEGGTYRGYKSLLDGTTDIALASSAPSEEVLKLLNPAKPTFISTTVAFAAMAPIVHPGNALRDLKLAQLRDIFTGRIANWRQLGGRDLPIKVLIGPPADGLTESWRLALIGATDSHTPKVAVLDADKRIKRVAADPGAISFISLANLDQRVKAITVDGIKVDEDNVRSGRYGLVAPLMLVTTAHPSAATREFVGYFSGASKRLRFPGFIPAQAGMSADASRK